jgi:RNA polymerase sigma-70 factor (ECF subfamily)
MRLLNLIPAMAAFALLQVALWRDDDAGLVRRLKAHEPKAMADLYRRYGRVAYSVILRIVRNTAVAEDLTQETFLHVWNRVGLFDAERGALGPWMLTVARNRAIDHIRSQVRRLEANAVDFERLERPGRFVGLEESALTVDCARRLKRALEKLNANQRTVIELAYYEGMSHVEMAERLQQPLGTVKTWMRTALEILRTELSEAAIA